MNFKDLLRNVAVMAFALLMSACGGDDKIDTPEEEAGKLVASRTSVAFNAAGGEESLSITANKDWTATTSSDWLTIAPASGSGNASVKFTAAANTAIIERSAKVEFKIADKVMATVTAVQNPYGPALTVTPETYELTAAADTVWFDVKSNGDNWDVTISADAEDWLTVVEGSQSLTAIALAAAPNRTIESLETAVLFTLTDYPDTKKEVTVSQAAYVPVLSVTPASGAIPAMGGVLILEIAASDAWEIDLPAEADWLEITDQTETTVTLTGVANEGLAPRETSVSIFLTDYYTVATQSIKISQTTPVAPITVKATGPGPYDRVPIAGGLTFTWELTEGAAPSGYLLVVGRDYDLRDEVTFATATAGITLSTAELETLLGPLKGDVIYWSVRSVDGPTVVTSKWSNLNDIKYSTTVFNVILQNYDVATAVPPKSAWLAVENTGGQWQSTSSIQSAWDDATGQWHSAISWPEFPFPMHFTIDLSQQATISGLTYRPRSHQDGLDGKWEANAGPKNIRLEISADNVNWEVLYEGQLPSGWTGHTGGTRRDTDVRAEAPKTGRYFKFVIIDTWYSNPAVAANDTWYTNIDEIALW
ncbi:MAG: discoidin domain-containing protein [Bacteroidales bacterium]|jgi:hypothetical protein|nr:discoidin domain-containing protein [Bacteroidales bacterium]